MPRIITANFITTATDENHPRVQPKRFGMVEIRDASSTRLVAAGLLVMVSIAATAGIAAPPSDTSSQTEQAQSVEEAIGDAVQQLASPAYRTRQLAWRRLQSFGLASQPILEQVAKESDADSAARAHEILENLRYGILPTTDPITRKYLLRFRDGNSLQQLVAFERLLIALELSPEKLENLVSLVKDPKQRLLLVERMVASEQVVTRFLDFSLIPGWVDRIGVAMDARWRSSAQRKLMSSPRMIRALLNQQRFDSWLELSRQQTMEDRQSWYLALMAQARSVDAFVEFFQLDELFKLAESIDSTRGADTIALAICSNPASVRNVINTGQWSLFIERVQNACSEERKKTAVQLALRHSDVVEHLFSINGFASIRSLTDRIESASVRGATLGHIAANPLVLTKLEALGRWDEEIATLIAIEKIPFLESFYRSLLRAFPAEGKVNEAIRSKASWFVLRGIAQLNRSDLTQEALTRLSHNQLVLDLTQHSVANKSGKPLVIDQLFVMLDSLEPSQLAGVLSSLILGKKTGVAFEDPRYLIRVLQFIGEINGMSQQSVLRSLFSRWQQAGESASSILTIIQARAVDLPVQEKLAIISMLLQTPSVRYKPSADFSRWAIQILKTSTSEQASLSLDVVRQNETIFDAFAKPEKRSWWKQRLKVASPASFANAVQKLIRRGRNPHKLLDDEMLSLVLRITGDLPEKEARGLLPNLLRSQIVAERLQRDDQVDEWLRLADLLQDPADQINVTRAICSNTDAMNMLQTGGRLDVFLESILREKNSSLRHTKLGIFLSSPVPAKHFASTGKLSELFDSIQQESLLADRIEFVQPLVTCKNAPDLLGESQRLLICANLASQQAASKEPALLAQAMFKNPYLLPILIREQLFFPMYDLVAIEPDFATPILHTLLKQATAIDAFAKENRLKSLVHFTARPGDSQRSRIRALLRSEPLMRTLADSNQLHWLLEPISAEAVGDQRKYYLDALLNNQASTLLMMKAGQWKPVMNLVLNTIPVKDQGQLFESFLRSDRILQLIDAGKAKELFQLLDHIYKEEIRLRVAAKLLAPFTVAKLVDKGQIQIALDLADHDEYDSLRASFGVAMLQAEQISVVLSRKCQPILEAVLREAASDWEILYRLTAKQSIIDALDRNGLLSPLIHDIEQRGDTLKLKAILLTCGVFDFLARDTQLNPWLQEIVASDDSSAKTWLFERITYRPSLHQAVVRNGHLLTVVDWWLGKDNTNGSHKQRILKLIAADGAVPLLRRSNHSELLRDLLDSDASSSDTESMWSTVGLHQNLIDWLLECESIVSLDLKISRISIHRRPRIRDQIFFSPASTLKCVQTGHADEWGDLFRGETTENQQSILAKFSYRQGSVFAHKEFLDIVGQWAGIPDVETGLDPTLRTDDPKISSEMRSRRAVLQRLLKSNNVLQHIVSGGNVETLRDWKPIFSNWSQFTNRILFSDVGEAAFAIEQGRFKDAEKIIRTHQAEPDAAYRYPLFLYRLGRWESAANWPQENDAAQGDVNAESVDLWVTAGRWQKAARAQSRIVEDWNHDKRRNQDQWSRDHVRVHCQLALLKHYAGHDDSLTELLQRMDRRTAKHRSKDGRSDVGLAHIVCGQVTKGIKILWDCDPVAGLWHALNESEYSIIANQVPRSADAMKTWLDTFKPPLGTPITKRSRVQLGTLTAECLMKIDRDEDAYFVYGLVANHANKLRSKWDRDFAALTLARSLYRAGEIDRCIAAILNRWPSRRTFFSYARLVFDPHSQKKRELQNWCSLLQNHFVERQRKVEKSFRSGDKWPRDVAIAALRAVEAVAAGRDTLQFDGETLTQKEFIERASASVSSYYVCRALEMFLANHGDVAGALASIERHPEPLRDFYFTPELYFADKQFKKAADHYLAAWNKNAVTTFPLLMSEIATALNGDLHGNGKPNSVKTGKTETGKTESGQTEKGQPEMGQLGHAWTRAHPPIVRALARAIEPRSQRLRAISLAKTPLRQLAIDELSLSQRMLSAGDKEYETVTQELMRLAVTSEAKVLRQRQVVWSRTLQGKILPKMADHLVK